MSKGVNKVILIGRLGQDPEVRYMPSGGAVCNVSLATSDSWRDKETGENNEATEWHRLVFFNRVAEIAGQYLKKGSKVYIEGSLRTRKWQDNQGQEKSTTEVVVREMQMLDSKDSRSNNQEHSAQPASTLPKNQPMGVHTDGRLSQGQHGSGDPGDNIPF